MASAATLDPGTTPPLRDHLRACAEAVHPGGAAALEAHLDAGTALLLLDGLDEIPASDRRTRVVRAVEVLLVGLPPNNRCVISTRPEGGFPIAGTVERHLAPLDESQIRRLLTNLLRTHAARTGTSPDLRAEVDALLERLDPASQIDDLAHNPLLVTIIAACSLAGVTLPHDRIVLYHRILRDPHPDLGERPQPRAPRPQDPRRSPRTASTVATPAATANTPPPPPTLPATPRCSSTAPSESSTPCSPALSELASADRRVPSSPSEPASRPAPWRAPPPGAQPRDRRSSHATPALA